MVLRGDGRRRARRPPRPRPPRSRPPRCLRSVSRGSSSGGDKLVDQVLGERRWHRRRSPSAMIGRPASVVSTPSASETISASRSASSKKSRCDSPRAPARAFRRQDVTQRQQDLPRQLAVAPRRPQPVQRGRDRLRHQLADVAHAVAVRIQRVTQGRQHQHGQQQRVRRRHRAPRGRTVRGGQVAPQPCAPQRRVFVLGLALESARDLGRHDVEQLGLEQQLHRPLRRTPAQQAIDLLETRAWARFAISWRCSIMRR